MPLPDPGAVRSLLVQVVDPEVGMNIVDLGLVYDVRVLAGRIEIDITMTTPSCPMGDLIVDEARNLVVGAAPPGTDIRVNLVWDPPWDASMMSEYARKHFGWQ